MFKKKLLIIDGGNLSLKIFNRFLNRPRGLLKDLKARNMTNFLVFPNLLTKIIERHNPTTIKIVFDAPPPTFRHQLYSQYQKGLMDNLQDYQWDIDNLKTYLHKKHPIIEQSGYEADDVISSLTNQLAGKPHWQIVIVTGDRDLLQLADDALNVSVFIENTEYTQALVESKFGIRIWQYPDFQAIAGNHNIPGIEGFGELETRKLLEEFPCISTLAPNIQDLPQHFQTKLKGRELQLLTFEEITNLKTILVS